MTRAVFLVFSDPASPEMDAQYNEWYDDVHLPDVLSIPGIVSARRFKSHVQPRLPGDVGEYGYLAMYELDSDDLEGTLEALKKEVASGNIGIDDAMGRDPRPATGLFAQLS